MGRGAIKFGNLFFCQSEFMGFFTEAKEKTLQTWRERGQRLSEVKKKQLLPVVLELQTLVSHREQNRRFAFPALSKFFCIITGILEAY